MSLDPLNWLDNELDALSERKLLRSLKVRGTGQGPAIVLDGQTLVNFGSNDYLGLATDPRLAAAARQAAESDGWGAGASPLVTGRGTWHARLEQALAEFEGCEAALLFPSGFAANAGAVPALVDQGDVILADAKNHASLIDGCRLSRATVHVYRHADCDHLSELLQSTPTARRRLIVTDGLFSMDGDLAPLSRIVELAEQYNAMLLVDEAHATGVLGKNGRGTAEHFGVEQAVHIKIGTLSKALGSAGGFVCGSRRLIDFLANRARSYVFSTAQPGAVAAAALAALEIVSDEPQRRQRLLTTAAGLRHRLAGQGWNLAAGKSNQANEPASNVGPIIPLFVGQPEAAVRLSAALAERGYFVPGIRPPTVPEGESLLRISLSYSHTPEMIDGLLNALAAVRATVGSA